jgi:kinetochore protein NDC80
LAHARTAAIANGLGVKSRLQALQFRSVTHILHSKHGNLTNLFAPSYKEQIEKVSRLKEDAVRAILKNSQEIAIFKEEVSKHLQELRSFTEVE